MAVSAPGLFLGDVEIGSQILGLKAVASSRGQVGLSSMLMVTPLRLLNALNTESGVYVDPYSRCGVCPTSIATYAMGAAFAFAEPVCDICRALMKN